MYKAVGRWAFRRQRWWIREQQCTVEARTSCWAVALMLAITCISRTLSPVKSIIPLLPNVFWGVHPFWSCTLLDIQVVANIYPMAQHDVCAFMVHHSSRIHHWYTILHLSIIGTLLFTYPSLVHYSSCVHHRCRRTAQRPTAWYKHSPLRTGKRHGNWYVRVAW